MMRSTSAASGTLRANTDAQSSARHALTIPVDDTLPTVGLMPTQPQKCAGTRPVWGMTKCSCQLIWPTARE